MLCTSKKVQKQCWKSDLFAKNNIQATFAYVGGVSIHDLGRKVKVVFFSVYVFDLMNQEEIRTPALQGILLCARLFSILLSIRKLVAFHGHLDTFFPEVRTFKNYPPRPPKKSPTNE